ncbi:MAG: hypothetical protein RL017_78 [Pseudomonadota bacterium]|jgi:hypothetical protein
MTNKATKKIDARTITLLILAMLYVAFKLTCNTLFFRQTLFNIPFTHINIRIVSSAFLYAGIYVISDGIVAISNRSITILVIIIGVICDGLFSGLTYLITTLHMPQINSALQQINTNAINQLGPEFWQLYYHGVIAAITAAIIEVIIFSFIFKKSNNFFISTISSVIIILFAHNTITDYPLLKSDPHAWRIILNGLGMNISVMAIYAAIITIILGILKKYNLKKIKIYGGNHD